VEQAEYARTAEAEESHFWFRELRWIWRGLTPAKRRETPHAGRALDAGCGTGGNLRVLEAAGPAFGVDIAATALAIARGKTSSPLVRASITSLPFRSGSFGLVLSTDVIYHMDVGDDVAALREIRRILRPGGTVILNVPAFEALRSAHDRAVHTARRYNRGMLRDRLQAAGLVPRRILYWNTLLLPPAALVRLARRGGSGRSDITKLPKALNGTLSAIARLDSLLALAGVLPFGLSIAASAIREPREP
jgi:SAM-dependent methyltransferase